MAAFDLDLDGSAQEVLSTGGGRIPKDHCRVHTFTMTESDARSNPHALLLI
jgi:hypothetical protein